MRDLYKTTRLASALPSPPKLHRLYRQLLFTPHLSPYKQHLTLTLYLTSLSDFRIFHSVNLCPNTPLKVLIFGPTQTGTARTSRAQPVYLLPIEPCPAFRAPSHNLMLSPKLLKRRRPKRKLQPKHQQSSPTQVLRAVKQLATELRTDRMATMRARTLKSFISMAFWVGRL